MRFMKYLGVSHYNNMNIAVYSTETKAVYAELEHLITDEVLGRKKFDSLEACEDWFSDLPGNILGRLVNAMEEIDEQNRCDR